MDLCSCFSFSGPSVQGVSKDLYYWRKAKQNLIDIDYVLFGFA